MALKWTPRDRAFLMAGLGTALLALVAAYTYVDLVLDNDILGISRAIVWEIAAVFAAGGAWLVWKGSRAARGPWDTKTALWAAAQIWVPIFGFTVYTNIDFGTAAHNYVLPFVALVCGTILMCGLTKLALLGIDAWPARNRRTDTSPRPDEPFSDKPEKPPRRPIELPKLIALLRAQSPRGAQIVKAARGVALIIASILTAETYASVLMPWHGFPQDWRLPVWIAAIGLTGYGIYLVYDGGSKSRGLFDQNIFLRAIAQLAMAVALLGAGGFVGFWLRMHGIPLPDIYDDITVYVGMYAACVSVAKVWLVFRTPIDMKKLARR